MKHFKYFLPLIFGLFYNPISYCQAPTLAEIEQRALEKARELGDLLKIIGDKRNDRKIRQNAKDLAIDLFESDSNKIEVISKLSKKKSVFSIREYLNRLDHLPYDDVQIEWKYIQVVEDIKQKEDGSYYGKLRVYQLFEGQGADKIAAYKDITEKDIEVKIQDQQIETGLGAGRKYFNLKFGDMTVYRLLDDTDKNKP
ncbi:MAG: hypothetical protein IPK91_05960 [Saprospiraceae bacterium]|nr:hypothetical protein [Saprospiraceae bacterium]MBK8296815.1 hypothetical protein [Saprospiraceae bacterium]